MTTINWKELSKKPGVVVSGSDKQVIQLEKGESVIGKFLGIEQVQIGDKEPFNSFSLETETGVKQISGTIIEQSMRIVSIGSIVRITQTGKKKTASGNKMTLYQVELLTGSINEKEKKKLQEELQKKFSKGSKKKVRKNDA